MAKSPYIISDAIGNLRVKMGRKATCEYVASQWYPGVDLRVEKVDRNGYPRPVDITELLLESVPSI